MGLQPVMHADAHATHVDAEPADFGGTEIAHMHGRLADAEVLHESHRVVGQAHEAERDQPQEQPLGERAAIGEGRRRNRHRDMVPASAAAGRHERHPEPKW